MVLGLQRIAGRTIAVARLTLPPNSLRHEAIQHLFPLITKGDDFSIVVETSSRDVHTYASVLQNTTNAAKFVPPATTSSMAFQRRTQ